MNIFSKISNGWTLSMDSLKVLKENKSLIIFPILSGISMTLIIGSFIVGLMISGDWQLQNVKQEATVTNYILLFVFYVFNYFVVVFFNTALIQCTRDYFNGEVPSIAKGLRFSVSRLGAIFSWSLFAGTVGFALRALQENLGSIGKIITAVIGVVWSIATFFVVPIISFENLSPIEAVKRSGTLMKQKWGETLGSTFSFGLVRMLGLVVVCVPLFFLGLFFNGLVAGILVVLGAFFVMAVFSAAQTIFVSAVYHDLQGDPVKIFNERFADHLFQPK